MTRKEIAKFAAAYSGVTIRQANDVINAFLSSVEASLSKGESVILNEFGTFEMKHRNARTGRNPHTREAVPIPARDVPVWVPSKSIKERLGSNK